MTKNPKDEYFARYRSSYLSIVDVFMSGMNPEKIIESDYCVAPDLAVPVWLDNIKHLNDCKIETSNVFGIPNNEFSAFVTVFDEGEPGIKEFPLVRKDTPLDIKREIDKSENDYCDNESRINQLKELTQYQHIRLLGAYMMWSKRYSLETGDRQCLGLYNSVKTNVIKCPDNGITLSILEDFITKTLANKESSSELYGFCSLRTYILVRVLFTSSAQNDSITFQEFRNGKTGLLTSKIVLNGRTLYLTPINEFRQCPPEFGNDLLILDPKSVFVFVGSHPIYGLQLCSTEGRTYTVYRDTFIDEGVHAVSTFYGFGLFDEKTCGLITNIQTINPK